MNYFKKSFASALLALLVTLTATAQVGIGTTTPSANTKFEIIAAGSTSATTSLRVGTASGTTLLSVKDNGSVGIGTLTPASSAALEVSSTSGGFLPPRMTNAEKNALGNSLPAGLIIWCTDCGTYGQLQYNDGNAWYAFQQTTATAPSTPLSASTNQPLVADIENTVVRMSGSVSGGTGYSYAGFVYTSSTGLQPTVGNISSTSTSASYVMTGTFSTTITNLTPGTLYNIRAYVSPNVTGGPYTYGNTISFTTTNASVISPTVTTNSVNVTPGSSSATFNGTITSFGNGTISGTGFYYSTDQTGLNNLTPGTYSQTSGMYTPNATTFNQSLSGLTAATYYVRAFASNSAGTGVGGTVSFTITGGTSSGTGGSTVSLTTNTPTPLSTPAGLSVSANLGAFSGNVQSSGFEYTTMASFTAGSISTTYTSPNPSVTSAGGSFSTTITGLLPNQSYRVRAFITYTTAGSSSPTTQYGNEQVAMSGTARISPGISSVSLASRSVASSYFSNIFSNEISRTLMHEQNQPELPSAPLEGDRSSAVFIGRGRLNN